MDQNLTPAHIVRQLDKYIIGQHNAKKSVAIALRNRWRRMNAEEELRGEIIPNNILLIGPTGVGKTEIARRLAQLAQAPFTKVEASKFTEVGYVGRDVESMVRDLVEHAVSMVTAEQKERIRGKAIENANKEILDVLIPPNRKSPKKERNPMQFILGNTGEAETEDEPDPQSISDSELQSRTREKLREKLLRGELDDREIEVEMTVSANNVKVVGPMGMEGMDGLQEMLENMMPKKKKKRKMKISDAREYFIEMEAEKLIDSENVQREALDRAANSGIIFIDEIDKIAVSGTQTGGGSGPAVSREGVQRDLLPIVEGSVVNTKYGSIKTDHVLFVAAGAFHVSKPSDLIPELQGRFPIRVELESLSQEDFVKILAEPRNALTKQYQALLASEGVSIEFTQGAIEALAELAFEVNQEVENIGARRLHTIMTNLLDDLLFEVPDLHRENDVKIDRAFVEEKLNGLVKSRDLSQYIL